MPQPLRMVIMLHYSPDKAGIRQKNPELTENIYLLTNKYIYVIIFYIYLDLSLKRYVHISVFSVSVIAY